MRGGRYTECEVCGVQCEVCGVQCEMCGVRCKVCGVCFNQFLY